VSAQFRSQHHEWGAGARDAAASVRTPARQRQAVTFEERFDATQLEQRVEEALRVPAEGARVSPGPTAGVANDAPAFRGDP
jgi:hypothetical protein